MRDFARLENSKMKSDDEFSASACQKIHSELLASVNEIYKNMKTKPLLKRNAISTSSLSNVPNYFNGLLCVALLKMDLKCP